MWFFTPQAFLSIVAHRDDARLRLVRARRPGEIEVLLPACQKPPLTPTTPTALCCPPQRWLQP